MSRQLFGLKGLAVLPDFRFDLFRHLSAACLFLNRTD